MHTSPIMPVATPGDFDWAKANSDAQLDYLETCSPEEGRAIAQGFDWSVDPRYALCWLMAQKYMDLATALNVFLAGQPHRFNYMPKRDVPPHLQGATQVLDIICLRVNSGFFLIRPDVILSDPGRIQRWLDVQALDRAESRQGRFVLDERVVERLLKGEINEGGQKETMPQSGHRSGLRGVFSPFLGRVVSRLLAPQPPRPGQDLNNLRY